MMIRRILFILFIISLGITLASCQNSFNNVDEYEKYVKSEDSPYYKSYTRNGIKIQCRYLPTDALLINQYKQLKEEEIKLSNNKSISKEELRRIDKLKEEINNSKKSYNESIYFMITIGYEDGKRDIEYEKMGEGFNQYSQWLQKLLFSLNEYIYLETDKVDEVPLSLYQMDRTFGMTKDRSFMLLFPKEFNGINLLDKSNKYIKLRIREFGLNAGLVGFEYELPIKEAKFELE